MPLVPPSPGWKSSAKHRICSLPRNATKQAAGPGMSRNLSLKLRYAILLILLGLLALIETRQPFPSFRLVSFILAFLALVLSASLLRGKLRDGFVVLASLAFGLSIVEAATILLDRQGGVIASVTNGWSVPQPVIGWGPQHAGSFHAEKSDPQSGVSIYKADYTIDSNLLRETRSAETGPTIAFLAIPSLSEKG